MAEENALIYERKTGWERRECFNQDEVFDFCKGYKMFLDYGKTERECVALAIRGAESKGFSEFRPGQALKPGDKVYFVNREKGILLACIGEDAIENGVQVLGAHVDAPRIDLKQNPLYEDNDLAYFKTHYYGGIKKYQWMTLPLAIHGVVYKANGERVELCIGEAEDDPVFCITDILPHLATEQMQKKLQTAINAEEMNLLVGSITDDSEKEKVKHGVLKLLNEQYGMTEEDFISAELELVPAQKAKDVGFDKSLIGSYGQDDRVCAYAAYQALLDLEKTPKKTAVCLLVDKEEIGSMGNTGMQSAFFENAMAELINAQNGAYNELMLRRALTASKCLSADVNAAVDSSFPNAFEKSNNSFVNHGVVLTKFTGSRGKSGASDANAEFVYEMRKCFNDAGVLWQTGELGKVDVGGGGTIAQFVANLGLEVIDCGVAVLSMHAPFEVTGKLDVYMLYKGFKAFLDR